MRQEKPWLPAIGHRKLTEFLPRDIKLGEPLTWTTPKIGCLYVKGQLLLGWDETSETLQLWRVVNEEQSEFIGFITNESKYSVKGR